ncbi:MAG: YbjN domain-containing protein [Pseudomonadota bacterium]
MATIWKEEDVTLENLASHITDSGLTSMHLEENRILLRTDTGTGFSIALDEEQKFIRISTYLPLDKKQSRDKKLALEHRFNEEIMLPTFCVDEDDDLHVLYVMSYRFGLIAGQFMSIVNRFDSLLEYIVRSQNEDRIIRLGAGREEDDVPALDNRPGAEGVLLN